MESVTLDAVDRGLLHALQVDGRASFSRIAEVLDVSDRTAARRYARLRAHGLIRVTGVVDSRRLGHSEWLVRGRVRPGAASTVALALARRRDTAWVSVLNSGTEVSAVFRVPGSGAAPLDAVARHTQIVSHDAHLLWPLSTERWRGRTAALSADQIDALRPQHATADRFDTQRPQRATDDRIHAQHPEHAACRSPQHTESPQPSRTDSLLVPRADAVYARVHGEVAGVDLSDIDRRLLPALAHDGRAGYPHLSRALGWSESAVRRRLEELRRHQILRFDVEVDARVLGFRVQAALWLTVAPARVGAVAQELGSHPEVAFVGATTGAHNLIAVVVCRDTATLFEYLTTGVHALDGVERMETTPIAAIAKRSAPTTGAIEVDTEGELAQLGPTSYRPLRVRDTPF